MKLNDAPLQEPLSTEVEIYLLEAILKDIVNELRRATIKHGPFPSDRHGHSVIEEEFDEFWETVKFGTLEEQRIECIQISAMAIRFLMDVK